MLLCYVQTLPVFRTLAALLKYMNEEDAEDDYDVAKARQSAVAGWKGNLARGDKQVNDKLV